MRRSIFLLFVLFGIAASVDARENSANALVGRWYCKGPSGNGVTDRYTNGRFATKDYLQYDSRRSPEVIVSWGRWKLHAGTYSEIVDGATSEAWLQFPWKWYSHEVSVITASRFSYISNDGHDTEEHRYRDSRTYGYPPLGQRLSCTTRT